MKPGNTGESIWYHHEDSTGAAVIIVKDDVVRLLKTYGMANREIQQAVSEQSSFRLASISKQFIGMAIAMLEDAGRLSLDQTLTEILPDFPPYGRDITVRHLLHHLSGLTDYEDLIPVSQTKQVSDQDVFELYQSKTIETKFPPGSRYSYSNGGYVLLGLIIERLAQQSLQAFLSERIFSRLGMHSVMYQGEDTPIVSRVFGYSLIDGLWRRTDQSVTSATRGDGGIYASIMDLLHWHRALEPGHPNPLVSDAVLTRIVEPGLLDNGESCGYAYGWKIDRWRGLLRQSHTGSTIGFRTAIQRYPEHRLMIALLTNRNDGTPWTLAEDIAGRVLGLDA